MDVVRTHPRRTVARAIALLYGLGATVGVVTLLLPHPGSYNDAALWSNIALAYAGAAVFAIAAPRTPVWGIHLALLAGTALVTRAIDMSEGGGALYSFWYVWVGVFAFAFFGRRAGLVHTAVIGAAFAWVLNEIGGPVQITGWLMVVSSIAAAGTLVDWLNRDVITKATDAAERARALGAISSVAHELSRRTSPETAAPAICDAAVEVTGASGAALWQPNPDGTALVATAATEQGLVGTKLLVLGEPSGIAKAYVSGEAVFIGDAETAQNVRHDLTRRFGIRSGLIQPIVRQRKPVGVLSLYWRDPLPELKPELAELAQLVAGEAGLAIERTELFSALNEAALTDDLTGLPNRRHWDEHLGAEIARAKRESWPLIVAMLDLDHFKAYNDRHGHLAGDRMLKQAAARWRSRLRASDFLARYGGEEFALALPDCDLEDATALVDKLRSSIPGEVRCSAGIARWEPGDDGVGLVDRADRALYSAKRSGRDRIEIAGSESVQPSAPEPSPRDGTSEQRPAAGSAPR